MTVDEYNANLKAAYAPSTSIEDKKKILEAFLKFKSETVNQRDGCPKPAEDVISHLKEQITTHSVGGNNNTNSHKTMCYYFTQSPLVVTIVGSFIAGVLILIVWQYISPLFGGKG